MAQGGGGKRKRGDRAYSQDNVNDSSRPSPHRPDALRLAQQNHSNSPQHGHGRDSPNRGGRRGSRGGRPLNSPNGPHYQQRPPSSASNSMPSPGLTRIDQSAEKETKPTPTTESTSTQTTSDVEGAPYYFYEDFPDDVVKSWDQSRKQTIVQAGRVAKESAQLQTLRRIYQETLRSGLDGRIPIHDAADIVSKIVNDTNTQSADSVLDKKAAEDFLDVVAIAHQLEGHHPELPRILVNCGIPLDLIRTNLDDALLEQLRLVQKTFSRSAVRYGTNILYRMKIYNLIREETEGYSKLITELFTTSGNESPSPENISALLTRVNAMIGTFNLDVGRVFDITMDVFAAVLVKHYRFFIKYLRASFWWPEARVSEIPSNSTIGLQTLPKWALPDAHPSQSLSEDEKSEMMNERLERDVKFWERVKEIGLKAYFELGNRRATPESLDKVLIMNKADLKFYQDWVEQTGTVPPPGNKVAAQILGLKLQFYESPCRDEEDTMPSNLIYLTALLIKVGFLSFFDLYPYLWPSDDQMASVEEQKRKEKKERDMARKPGGGSNALTRAAALTDDTLPVQSRKAPEATTPAAPSKSDAKETKSNQENAGTGEKKNDLPEPVDQKIQLLRSLLCIGALPEAVYMMGRFKWLPELVPDIPEHINRILHHSLTRIYEPLRPLKNLDAVRESAQVTDLDQASTQKGELKLIDQPPRKVLRWAQIDKTDSSEGIDYRFYWEDWIDNIPMCNNVDDVFLLCKHLLNFSGLQIGRDPVLLAKLARIGIHSLDTDTSEDNSNRWFDLCKRLLVPALTFSASNSGIVSEVWTLLKRYPTAKRYNIYAEWYYGQTSRNDDVRVAFDATVIKTKAILKRVSKDNVKTMARAFAKVAVSSPGKVFEVMLNQIESYSNLIEVVTDVSRYLTDLAYDILTWSLVNALGKSRSRVQEDGMLTSKWLSALGSFSGSIFKRYGVMNPTPVLQYVAHQLHQGNSTDLVVLDSIVYYMAGIVSDATLGENHVLATTGGPFLRSRALQLLEDTRHQSNMKSSSRRLMKALINSKLAGLLLVSICQQRQACLFSYPHDNAPLKLLGNLFDEIHRVLTQYLDLLHTNLSQDDFSALIPSISDMIANFGIEPNMVFWIWRPFLAAEIVQHDKIVASEKIVANEKVITENIDDSIETQSKMKQDASQTNGERSIEGVPTDDPTALEVLNKSADLKSKDQAQRDLQQPEPKSICHPVIQRVIESVRPVLPAATFETLSESFYFTFWRLSPYDMHVPDAYQDECRKLTLNIEQTKSDRSKEYSRKTWTELHSNLSTEYKDHLTAHLKIKAALQKEKDSWFDHCSPGKAEDLSLALLEYCFLPRMLISSIDAFFVFKMFKFLHTQGAKNFTTILVLDCLLNAKRLTPLIFMCTAKEAENVGRFLNEVLKDLAKWHANSETFEREAHGPKKDLGGFYIPTKGDRKGALLDYEGFRSLLLKWHGQLHDALRACFLSSEYMHIRNAVIILRSVSSNFPTVKHMGESLVKCITDLSASETRSDLKLAALSLIGSVERRKSQWIIRQEFSLNKPSVNGTSTPNVAATKARTPQPETSNLGKGLNAKAPEFIPNSSSLKAPSRTAAGKGDGEEDGEIKDTASAKAQVARPTIRDALKSKQRATAENNGEAKVVPTSLEGGAKELAPSKRPSPQPRQSEPPAKDTQKLADLPAIPPKPRPENIRNQSDLAAAGRPAHSLPSRPETNPHASRTAGQRSNDRLNDRVSRDSGDLREPTPRRNERTSENTPNHQQERHEASRAHDRQEKSYQDERDREVTWGGEQLPSSRPHNDRHTQHPRDARPPLREERSDRNLQDRHSTQSRDHRNEGDLQAPRSKDNSMAPPRSSAAQHQDRTSATQSSQDMDRNYQTIHPDRRPEGIRVETHGHTSSQRGSRTSSPSRRDEQSSHIDYHRHRDDRAPPDNRRYGDTNVPTRHDASRLPTGPRTERQSEVSHPGHAERPRDNTRSSSYASTPEASTGRLNQDFGRPRQQESQYGRLNQDPPAGPRMPNGTHGAAARGNRMVSAPQPHTEVRPPQQPPQSATLGTPDKPTPTGPASGRAPPRNQTQSNRPPPITTSIPSASVAESPDTAGVHPDRLKAIQSSGLENPGFMRKPPTPVEAPVGPRNPQNSQPQESHPPSRPSGPPVNTAAERGRGDKRFAGINTVLSQTKSPTGPERGNQGASIRGRHARSNISSSPITNGPPRRDFPTPTESGPPPRQDLFASRPPGGNMGPARDYDGSYDRGGPRPGDRKPAPRQRDARSMSPRRDAPPSRQRDDMRPPRMDEGRDYRGRGGPMPLGPSMTERDRRGGPPARDNVGPAGPKDRRDEAGWGGDGRMGPDRRDNRPERRASGMEDGGSGRKRGRGPEEGYEQGRPPMQHEYPKRARRGG